MLKWRIFCQLRYFPVCLTRPEELYPRFPMKSKKPIKLLFHIRTFAVGPHWRLALSMP